MDKIKAILALFGSAFLFIVGIIIGRKRNTDGGAVGNVKNRIDELKDSNRDSQDRAKRIKESGKRITESGKRIDDAADSAEQSIDRIQQIIDDVENGKSAK